MASVYVRQKASAQSMVQQFPFTEILTIIFLAKMRIINLWCSILPKKDQFFNIFANGTVFKNHRDLQGINPCGSSSKKKKHSPALRHCYVLKNIF